MKLTRFADAAPYEAANHFDTVSLRLQGYEDGGPTNQWVGLSHYLPGGRAGPDSSPVEKIYVILAGELTVTVGGQEAILYRHDSCTIAAGEMRTAANRSNEVCTILVVIPYPPAA